MCSLFALPASGEGRYDPEFLARQRFAELHGDGKRRYVVAPFPEAMAAWLFEQMQVSEPIFEAFRGVDLDDVGAITAVVHRLLNRPDPDFEVFAVRVAEFVRAKAGCPVRNEIEKAGH